MRRSAHSVIGIIAATSVLAACGSTATSVGADAQSKPDVSSNGETPAETTGKTKPQSPSDSGRQNAKHKHLAMKEQFVKNKGAWDLVLRDVRVGEHKGFERFVAEFRGTGTPGWSIRYVTAPRAEGSGAKVDVYGDNFLAVSISGVTLREGYPKVPEDFFGGHRHFAPPQGEVIEDVNVVGVFEGYEQLFLGLDGDKVPFRVFTLQNPSRLVVDVMDH